MTWQPVTTHVGLYEVSEDGVVRHKSGRILKQWHNSHGYPLVRLSSPRIVAHVHRLVALAFIPNPDNLPFVNHLDFNRANNQKGNLEWCTQWQNLNHSTLAGRMPRDYWKGKRSPNAKVSDSVAAAIRETYKAGGKSLAVVGKEFNLSKRSVGRIVAGVSYV